jgi:hypothetical protein
MADKDTGKAKRAAKPEGRTLAGGSPAADAEVERDALKAELAAAKVRIEALETANAEAVNRINWIIDSLQSLKDDVKS